ncbi:MAG: hypothetical protein ACJ8F1_02620 [Polyangia bacterium]
MKTKLLMATMFIGSTVFAQAPTPVPPTAPAAPPAAVDLSVKQRPVLTPAEMVNQSKDYLHGMAETVKRIQGLQEEAKKQKDIIRLNCVTDKLVQARVNENIAEQSMASLQEGVAKNDEGSETHEFTRLTIVNQKVTVLGAEAENCIGEDLSFVGATRVDVEVDPNLPQYDPTTPGSPFIDITRPAEASPVAGM